MTIVTGLDWPMFWKCVFTQGWLGAMTDPVFYKETMGIKSRDGVRGRIWSINVLSGYILVSPHANRYAIAK